MTENTKKRIQQLEKDIAAIRNTIQTKGGTPQLRAQRDALQKELKDLKALQQNQALDAENKLAEYGYAYGLIQSDPSLQALFQDFLDAGSSWEQPKLEAELRNTDWYKNNTLAKRNYEILRTGDPAEFQALQGRYTDWVKEQARLLGATISDEQAKGYADRLMSGGLDPNKASQIIASTLVDYNSADLLGRAGALQDDLVARNRMMGNILNPSQINNYVKQILTNQLTESDVLDSIKRTAASTYTNFSDRIMAGESIQDIASPYKKLMQDYLELADVDINDSLMLDALSGKGEKGGMKYASLSDFRKAVKSDPRWQYTDNARESYFNIGQKILKDFGFLG